MGTADGIRAAIGEARGTASLYRMCGEWSAYRYWRRIAGSLVADLKAALRESVPDCESAEEFAGRVADSNLMRGARP